MPQQERPDLETEERAQAAVIAEFLPQPLTEEEITQEVNAIIQETNASTMADMGKVMGHRIEQNGGKSGRQSDFGYCAQCLTELAVISIVHHATPFRLSGILSLLSLP